MDNPFFDEETVKEANYRFKTNKFIRTFVVPGGVQGFASDFMRGTQSLQLPESLHSPYGRQFKDSHVGTIRLPKEWKDEVEIGEYNWLRLKGSWFDDENYGYLRWPSTYIENLEFY